MILYSKQTDKGKRRKKNEDYCYIPDGSGPYGLAIVADGIGGYQGGEVASKLAVNVFCAMVKNADIKDDTSADETLFEAMNAANTAIIDCARDNEFYAGMGTTLVAAFHRDDKMRIINIGDSRAYQFNGKELIQVSRDHSLVQELIEEKRITKSQGRQHPRRNIITRALGDDIALPEIFYIDFKKNDIILLCSDGLSDMLDDEEIKSILFGNEYIEDMALQFIEKANESGGHDNITCVLVKNSQGEKGNG